MAMTAPQPAPVVSLRTIALSAIVPIDGFNPRMAFDDAERVIQRETSAQRERRRPKRPSSPPRAIKPGRSVDPV